MRKLIVALCLLLIPLKAQAEIHHDHHERHAKYVFHHAVAKQETDRQLIGTASYYSRFENGKRTASGERYNPYLMTAASKTLPLGSIIKVVNIKNGKFVILTVNDRGPYTRSRTRILDVSETAARSLGMLRNGVVYVRIIVLSSRGFYG